MKIQIIETLIKFWWTIPVFFYNVAYAYLSVQNSNEGTSNWKWFWITWAATLIPTWSLVAKYTPKHDMILTGLVFDIIILLGFQIGFIMFGCAKGFNMWQWSGLIVVMLGMIVFKMGG